MPDCLRRSELTIGVSSLAYRRPFDVRKRFAEIELLLHEE